MKRNSVFPHLSLFVFFSVAVSTYALLPEAETMIKSEFKDAATYSHKAEYSKTVSDVFLAYDKDGNVIYGAAARITTPWKFTSMIVVKKEGDTFTIIKAEFPDKATMKYYDKKKERVQRAIDDASNVVIHKAGKTVQIDAVSGATKYHKRLYAGFNLLAKTVVSEMGKNPGWEKKELK